MLFYACVYCIIQDAYIKVFRMEVEIIIGTYDCFIKGYSFDLIATDQVIESAFRIRLSLI